MGHIHRGRSVTTLSTSLDSVSDLISECISIFHEPQNPINGTAAAVAVSDNTLTTDVTASREAADMIDGGQAASTADISDCSVVKVDSTKVVSEGAAREGEGLETGEVPLDTVLENLIVGGLVELVSLAEHAAPGLKNARDLEPQPVFLADLGPVANGDVVLVHGIDHRTGGCVGCRVGHLVKSLCLAFWVYYYKCMK